MAGARGALGTLHIWLFLLRESANPMASVVLQTLACYVQWAQWLALGRPLGLELRPLAQMSCQHVLFDGGLGRQEGSMRVPGGHGEGPAACLEGAS